ncbi:MAG: hypothetical protein U0Q18_04050 [Bryobacteraceae bacterium]
MDLQSLSQLSAAGLARHCLMLIRSVATQGIISPNSEIVEYALQELSQVLVERTGIEEFVFDLVDSDEIRDLAFYLDRLYHLAQSSRALAYRDEGKDDRPETSEEAIADSDRRPSRTQVARACLGLIREITNHCASGDERLVGYGLQELSQATLERLGIRERRFECLAAGQIAGLEALAIELEKVDKYCMNMAFILLHVLEPQRTSDRRGSTSGPDLIN